MKSLPFFSAFSPAWAFRLSLAVIYIWFGALKMIPGGSPAEPLIRASVFWWDIHWFLPLLGLAEIIIGLSFLWPRMTRMMVILVSLHMLGASVTPFFTATDQLFVTFPFVWTLAGQYVFKNLLILCAAYLLWQARPSDAY